MDERYYRAEADMDLRRDSRDSRMSRLFSRDSRRAPETAPQQYSVNGSSGVVINSPSTYEDVQLLIDHLKMREQVIVDFSTVNQTSVYRILDFMSGAIYALGGSIQQITNNIFLFAPAGVTITIPPQFRR
ncbi:MAG: cell division protein SepF [Clostridia bacterium]|nr:cell division protein SepF [Clostridia bacterium]